MAKYGHINSLNSLQNLTVGNTNYKIFSLNQVQASLGDISKLPKSLKVLLENLLRFEDDVTVRQSDIQAIVD